MTNENSTADSANSLSTAARIGWAAMIVVTLAVCYFSNLGAIGFVGPDEPRYAWIARGMAESGDWVTPRLYGKPWFEKPVLYYWLAGASFKLFGVSEAAARLPSALCALFATLALAWLAWRVYGEETARWLLLLLPTSIGMIGFSHAASTDMPFSAMVTIAMVCAAVVLGLVHNEGTPILPRTPWLALILFGFFLGLAVLAKGPAGVILCGGGVFFWAIFTKRWRDALRLLHPFAIASFCATALPWYILCARRNPDFFRVFIIEHNFKRYLTPEFQHIQPFWYYVPVLIAAWLPWTALVLYAACATAKSWMHSRKFDHLSAMCWLIFGFCFLFFSTSKSKLPGYLLPGLPALGLAVATMVAKANTPEKRQHLSWFALSGGALTFLLSLAVGPFHVLRSSKMSLSEQSLLELILIALSVPLVLFGCAVRPGCLSHSSNWIRVPAVLWICINLTFPARAMLRLADPDTSARVLAGMILSDHLQDKDIGLFKIQRAKAYQLNFYLRREFSQIEAGQPLPHFVIADMAGLRELKSSGVPLKRAVVIGGGTDDGGLSLFEVAQPVLADGLPGSGQVRQEK